MNKQAFLILKRNDPLILASSTAFFTTFSLSPIVVILVNILSLYFKNDAIKGRLFDKLRQTFGKESTLQIEDIVDNVRSLHGNAFITIAGFIFLLFIATTLLKVVKQAINQLWQVKRKHVSRLKYTFVERSVATSLILSMGLLFVASILLDTTTAMLHDYIEKIVPSVHMLIVHAVNILFSILVVTSWFTILFKVLPDARTHWRVALCGGILTAVLFNLGKFVLGKLLLYNTVVNIFGASASFALILLFIFYSSLILYYGASFTYVVGDTINMPIIPGKYSNRFELKVLSDDEKN